MKYLLKGQIPEEFQLDYDRTFSEQSDLEDKSQQKLLENKQFLHVYDYGWRSEKVIKQIIIIYLF